MHSWAVDYPKNGNKVDIRDMPRSLIRFKPDWSMAENNTPQTSDYYKSDRALGHLFRNIVLEDMSNTPSSHQGNAEEQPISKVLWSHVRRHLSTSTRDQTRMAWIDSLYMTYREELTYTASTYSLSQVGGSKLCEEELVIGTILGKCTQRRYRSDRLYAMRENVGFLVQETKGQLVGRLEEIPENALKERLAVAWDVWLFSLDKAAQCLPPEDSFGLESFGLLGLGLVLECLERLRSLPPLPNPVRE
ncbi:hypothetical protein JVT61DRAFT_2258 [Boletus reticuloceps]|uniref:RNA-dependent RNA polymerase n=1 Tax=Boletus reticuloceps TaxID=495285 RepID=A0A8I3ABF5_9AGAM|nr:hypothetical protein JVT61DRAFT_2258 [Boletus reticuloceps]